MISLSLAYITPANNKTFVFDGDYQFQVVCTVPVGTIVVQWYKNGNIIHSNSRIYNVTSTYTSRLTVRNITLSDSGYYQCEVNGIRSALSGYINVISKY